MGIETRTSRSSGQCLTNRAKSTFSCQHESTWSLSSHALLILEMNKIQHVKWCMKQTKLTSEISCPTDSCLAQLVRSGGPGFNPNWVQFLTNFFCSSLRKDLSDNLTEMPILKNSIDFYLAQIFKLFVCRTKCDLYVRQLLGSLHYELYV